MRIRRLRTFSRPSRSSRSNRANGFIRTRRAKAEMNVVPYIDVMLVLLIIFMVTAPILTQGVRVKLPQTQSKPISQLSQKPFIISIQSNGEIYSNQMEQTNTPLTTVSLKAEISQFVKTHRHPKVYIRADQKVPYGKVVHIMAMLKSNGVASLGLITEPIHQNHNT